MMKKSMFFLMLLGMLFSCKETKPETQDVAVQEEDPFITGIKSLYDDMYTEMQKTYSIDKIDILKITEVDGNYVDSLRRNFFQLSMENIQQSNELRQKNYNKLKRKAFRHDSLDNELEAEYARDAMDQSVRAMETAEIELQQLKDLDSIALLRMTDNNYGEEIFYFVEFNIEMTVNQRYSSNSLSQLFDANKKPVKIHLLE